MSHDKAMHKVIRGGGEGSRHSGRLGVVHKGPSEKAILQVEGVLAPGAPQPYGVCKLQGSVLDESATSDVLCRMSGAICRSALQPLLGLFSTVPVRSTSLLML